MMVFWTRKLPMVVLWSKLCIWGNTQSSNLIYSGTWRRWDIFFTSIRLRCAIAYPAGSVPSHKIFTTWCEKLHLYFSISYCHNPMSKMALLLVGHTIWRNFQLGCILGRTFGCGLELSSRVQFWDFFKDRTWRFPAACDQIQWRSMNSWITTWCKKRHICFRYGLSIAS